MRARVRARGRIENVFVKPNEQNRACLSYAMARKRRMKSNDFTFHDKQNKNRHVPMVTAKKHSSPRLQGKNTKTTQKVLWFREKVGHFREKIGYFGRKVGQFRES